MFSHKDNGESKHDSVSNENANKDTNSTEGNALVIVATGRVEYGRGG